LLGHREKLIPDSVLPILIHGIPFAISQPEQQVTERAMMPRQGMTEITSATVVSNRISADSRRRQLRDLLLSAADAARQGRQVHRMAARATNRMGRAVRDRVSMLLSAAE
jgi:hypothetical protein